VLDRAVDLLLEHWTTRAPLGPCHYGIGTLFLQVEYPFRTYNLFFWVYVLSFSPRARADPRFAEALATRRYREILTNTGSNSRWGGAGDLILGAWGCRVPEGSPETGGRRALRARASAGPPAKCLDRRAAENPQSSHRAFE
jgi:hypothetical protein